jgi:hypothetical protein
VACGSNSITCIGENNNIITYFGEKAITTIII